MARSTSLADTRRSGSVPLVRPARKRAVQAQSFRPPLRRISTSNPDAPAAARSRSAAIVSNSPPRPTRAGPAMPPPAVTIPVSHRSRRVTLAESEVFPAESEGSLGGSTREAPMRLARRGGSVEELCSPNLKGNDHDWPNSTRMGCCGPLGASPRRRRCFPGGRSAGSWNAQRPIGVALLSADADRHPVRALRQPHWCWRARASLDTGELMRSDPCTLVFISRERSRR